jgi:DNA-binding MarR family transcriptional regulator
MIAHIRILFIINMFSRIPPTRLAQFTGLPEVSMKSELNELTKMKIIEENAGTKRIRTMLFLTEEGQKLYNYYENHFPEHVKSDIDNLQKRHYQQCKDILNSLAIKPMTLSEISNTTDIKRKELQMYLIFLEKNNHIEIKLEDNSLLHHLIKDKTGE